MKAMCPKSADHAEFITVARVTQKWKVTKTGEFLENLGGLEASSTPELGNIWICAICGAEAQMPAGESTLSAQSAETPTGTANARVLVAGREVLEALCDCVAAFERLKAECPKEWARIRSRAEHVAGDLGQAAHDAGTIIAMTTGKVVVQH